MSDRKLIRQSLFVAAMAVTAAHGTTALGFQQPQFQAGQQTPQGTTTVTQELNRMFQESGQQMPSMREQDLPNANTPIQGQIRPQGTQNTSTSPMTPATNHMQSMKATGTKSLLLKFFGKIKGNPSGANGPNYQPPVPPDYNKATPSTAATGVKNVQANGQTPLKNQNLQQQNSQPNVKAPNTPRSATVQTSNSNKPSPGQAPRTAAQGTTQFPNGAMSRIPPRSGSSARATTISQPVANIPLDAKKETRYTQPGSVPGFMATSGSTAVNPQQPAANPNQTDKFGDEFIQENTGGSVRARKAAEKAKSKTAAAGVVAKDAVNGFENPFLDAEDAPETSEVLDLDSLVEIPKVAKEPVRVKTKETVQPVKETAQPAPVPLAPDAVADAPAQNSLKVQKSKEFAETQAEDPESESALAPGENPFTGVQLDSSDAVLVNDAESANAPTPDTFGVPAPMEDFSSELPSIDLPPVGQPDSNANDALLEIPGVETKPPAADTEDVLEADTTGRAELNPVDDVPAAMNAADIERLRQTAEQERRQHQQRQIMVRAGQKGFKGFCPVALRERRELVDANPQFTSTFGLQTYTFSSAESKVAFDTDPSRYAPAAGGSDVVVLVNSGEEQAGQLDFALWYRDRLYLFRSRETMSLFSKDPQRFASQY